MLLLIYGRIWFQLHAIQLLQIDYAIAQFECLELRDLEIGD